MNRAPMVWIYALSLGAGLFAAAAGLGAAHAQMAAALGKPLPSGDLPAGTVTVRVIAGAPDKPLAGVDVELLTPDGAAVTARTDGEGRARFADLAPGGRYTARAQEPAEGGQGEARQATSESFTIPAQGGLRLMISTRPWSGPGGAVASPGAGPDSGGGGPMLDPRRMSGIPRGEPNDPPRTLTVSAVQGVVTNKIADHPVHVIGYAADGSVFKLSQKTGVDGRAVFDELQLDRVAYYVMTTYSRAGAAGPVTDRVRSRWVTMPPQVGVRLLLAGLAASSTEPGIDDLEDAPSGLAPGQVVVRVDGYTSPSLAVSLYEIVGQAGPDAIRKVATAPMGQPAPKEIQGAFGAAVQQPGQAAGTVTVLLKHDGQNAVPGMTVEIVPLAPVADSTAPSPGQGQASPPVAAGNPAPGAGAAALRQTTDTQGQARFEGLAVGAQYRAVATVHGVGIESAPFALPSAGGLELSATVTWKLLSSGEARFTGVAPDRVYFAEATFEGKPYRSAPFMTVPDRGAATSLLVFPRTLFSFHLTGEPLDEYMRFRAQMSITNYSYAPLDPGPEGLHIPLPEGFVQAAVADEDAERVKAEPERGLFYRGTIPPGRTQFLAGWANEGHDGRMTFDMNLPMGVASSSIVILRTPGMEVLELPPGVTASPEERGGQKFFLLRNITIMPDKSMHFAVAGMPQQPASRTYPKYVVGVAVLLLLAWGFYGVFVHRARDLRAGSGAQSRSAKQRARHRKLSKTREELLDALVALEARKKSNEVDGAEYDRERTRLKRDLETVYGELDRLDQRSRAPAA